MPGSTRRNTESNHLVLNGKVVPVRKHPTDFSVMASADDLAELDATEIAPMAPRMTRAKGRNASNRDALMDEVREQRVAHHIYEVSGTDEELVIDDRILLTLRIDGSGLLEELVEEFSLVKQGRIGDAHVLQLTDETGTNPLRLANRLREREGVASCEPHTLLPLRRFESPALFDEQWYLNNVSGLSDVSPGIDIDVPEAWQITKGDDDIVVAVIDDGFDLDHPAFRGTKIHPGARDFGRNNSNPAPASRDYHGTPVASIAVGSHHPDSAMRGIAPNCTLLPIRIDFSGASGQVDMLSVFEYVSARADVVNCSFGIPPQSFDAMAHLRRELTRLARTGGRRGKGLVIIFAAANDDAPTFLAGSQNINGVLYADTASRRIREIPRGSDVFGGYSLTEDAVVVGSVSSMKRKSGYSNWGPHLSCCAPSNNSHYIKTFVSPSTDSRRNRFEAHYRGRGQVAAINRPGQGAPFNPLFDDMSTPNLREDFYTDQFGGTSGAAPVVAGVAGLILSANPSLSAREVRQILIETADSNLDPQLDLANDPNVQGLSGQFSNGHSLFFGAGKVNALKAVQRAQALPGGVFPAPEPIPEPEPLPEPAPSPVADRVLLRNRTALTIPDDQPAGVESLLTTPRDGSITEIKVAVKITHAGTGDLRIALLAPNGAQIELQSATGFVSENLDETYTVSTTPGLAAMIGLSINNGDRWSLLVADHFAQFTGRLDEWSLELAFE